VSGYANTGTGNTCLGARSLLNNNTGSKNTAIGVEALNSISANESNNTALGYQAGANTEGNNNIFLGYNAGKNYSGDNKLFIENSDNANPLIWGDFNSNNVKINGHFQITETLKDKDGQTGTENHYLSADSDGKIDWKTTTSLGIQEINDLSDGKTGFFNTFLGYEAGNSSTGNATHNTSLGYQSLYSCINGISNVALGYNAGYLTNANNNVAIGTNSLYNNTAGYQNLAIGTNSLYSNKANGGSLAIGYQSMEFASDNSTGSYVTYNTAIGNGSLRGSTNASNNTGRGNTAIGLRSAKYK
jgi:hypothetical protein